MSSFSYCIQKSNAKLLADSDPKLTWDKFCKDAFIPEEQEKFDYIPPSIGPFSNNNDCRQELNVRFRQHFEIDNSVLRCYQSSMKKKKFITTSHIFALDLPDYAYSNPKQTTPLYQVSQYSGVRNACETPEGSCFEDDQILNNETDQSFDWNALKDKLKQSQLTNTLCISMMPTPSSFEFFK